MLPERVLIDLNNAAMLVVLSIGWKFGE